MSVFFNLPGLVSLVGKIREQFPVLPVLVGGQAFRWGGDQAFSKFNHVFIVRSLDDLITRFLTSPCYES